MILLSVGNNFAETLLSIVICFNNSCNYFFSVFFSNFLLFCLFLLEIFDSGYNFIARILFGRLFGK